MRTTIIFLILGLSFLFLSCGQKEGVRLLSYSKTRLCDTVKWDYSNDKPILREQSLNKGTLELSIRLIGNCTADYFGLMKSANDTLKLYYLPKGLFPEFFRKGFIIQDGYVPEIKDEVLGTFCDCYLEMHYKISGIEKFPKVIKINGDKVLH